jgi:hypothetical protein
MGTPDRIVLISIHCVKEGTDKAAAIIKLFCKNDLLLSKIFLL